ncbi:MAG: hypothetical protein HOV83_26240, partial [Catenulispora sp.]|nr:hypothetical protein [Catenulispora sp.]
MLGAGGTVCPPTTSGVDELDDGVLGLLAGFDDGALVGAVTEPVGCGVEGVVGAEVGAEDGADEGADVGVELGGEVGPPMVMPTSGLGVVVGVDVGVLPASATFGPVVLSWFAVLVPPVAPLGLNT